jgi:hypothetical protein
MVLKSVTTILFSHVDAHVCVRAYNLRHTLKPGMNQVLSKESCNNNKSLKSACICKFYTSWWLSMQLKFDVDLKKVLMYSSINCSVDGYQYYCTNTEQDAETDGYCLSSLVFKKFPG